MAHIVEFKITSLAGRKDVYSRKLNRHVNVFFGLNGSGKTSLLRILDSAMSNDAESIAMVPFEAATVKIHSIDYGRDFVRRIDRRVKRGKSSTEEPRRVKPSIERAVDEREISLIDPIFFEEGLKWKTLPLDPKDASRSRWRHIYLPTWRLFVEPREYSTVRDTIRFAEREYDLDEFLGKSLQNLWTRCSTEMLSKVRSIQEEGLASILRQILSGKELKKRRKEEDLNKIYGRVYSFLQRQQSQDVLGPVDSFGAKFEDPQKQIAISGIDMIEERIETAMAPRHRLETLIKTMFSGNKEVIFKDTGIGVITDEGTQLSLATMSSGEKHALGILMNTILAGESSLLIDEPEISMHVDWQTMLISAMRQLNPRAQLILATHSPDIMADVPDDKIFKL